MAGNFGRHVVYPMKKKRVYQGGQGGHSAHQPTGGIALFLGGKISSQRYFLGVKSQVFFRGNYLFKCWPPCRFILGVTPLGVYHPAPVDTYPTGVILGLWTFLSLSFRQKKRSHMDWLCSACGENAPRGWHCWQNLNMKFNTGWRHCTIFHRGCFQHPL